MNKPIIGIVGRENLVERIVETSVMSTDETYRIAVVKARRNSCFNITDTRL